MDDAAFEAGRRFGSFTLGRCIGRGGHAEVYVARQTSIVGASRVVALKLLHVPAHAPAIRETFRREASVAMRLEHPGIVRTYEVGEHEGTPFMAMELVDGATLDRLPAPVPVGVAVRILHDVAVALAYAHELRGPTGQPLGLVHQDVTPQNVMLGRDGRVRLLDFGVARLSLVDASRTDNVRGKPAYLSPEQLDGERIDRRTDVFALGIVGWELLAGQRLFKRETLAATYRAILIEPLADLRARRADAPEEVVVAIEHALRRDHGRRLADAEAFAAALGPGATDAELAAWARANLPAGHHERELVGDAAAEPTETALGHPPGAAAQEPTLAPKTARLAPLPTAPAVVAAPVAEHGAAAPPIAWPRDDEPVVLPKHPRWPARLAVLVFAGTGGLLALRTCHTPAVTTPAVAVADAGPTATALASTRATPEASLVLPVVVVSAAPERPARPPSAPRPSPPPAPSSTPATAPSSPAVVAQATAVTTPAPLARGYLSVRSNVWGHVEVDGRPVGDSPLARVPLAPGRHTVRIVTERGEQSRAIDVAVEEDSRQRFVF